MGVIRQMLLIEIVFQRSGSKFLYLIRESVHLIDINTQVA